MCLVEPAIGVELVLMKGKVVEKTFEGACFNLVNDYCCVRNLFSNGTMFVA